MKPTVGSNIVAGENECLSIAIIQISLDVNVENSTVMRLNSYHLNEG